MSDLAIALKAEFFVSLHDVLRRISAGNSITYQAAAKQLKKLLRNESDAPAWYRFTDWGERGLPEPEYGEKYGMRELLEMAAMVGDPVKLDPSQAYEHTGAGDLSNLPVFNFMINGPTLGFQIDAIGPFLARHGIKSFDVGAIDSKDAGSNNSALAKGNPRQRAQETAILAKLVAMGHDPKALERAPKGNKPWPLRVAIVAELKLSPEIGRKAWGRLRKDGRIQDA